MVFGRYATYHKLNRFGNDRERSFRSPQSFVELTGFEPVASSMPWKRATNCAIAPTRVITLQGCGPRSQDDAGQMSAVRTKQRTVRFGVVDDEWQNQEQSRLYDGGEDSG